MSADDWWKHGIVYQVYPRSFQDSNGDGIGDLDGIRARLDHLVSLGVDAVWISPIYPSPMADFGYDISDFCDIDPRFGTLAGFDALVQRGPRKRAQAHSGLRAQPHVGPSSVVRAEPERPQRSAARLVHLARPGAGRRAAQQLAQQFRRPGLDLRSGHRPVLRPFVPEGAARPQLAQPRRAGRDVRGAALLAAARRRRIPRRCALPDHQGRAVPRQPAESGLRPRARTRFFAA
jgi:hypothetical protein